MQIVLGAHRTLLLLLAALIGVGALRMFFGATFGWPAKEILPHRAESASDNLATREEEGFASPCGGRGGQSREEDDTAPSPGTARTGRTPDSREREGRGL